MKRPSPLSGKVQFKAKKLRIYCGSGGQQLNENVVDSKKLEIFFSNESAEEQIESLKLGTHPKFLETTRPFLELKERKEWIIDKFSRTRIEMVESQTKELEKFCEKQYEVWLSDFFFVVTFILQQFTSKQSLTAFKEKLLAKCNEEQKKFAEEMKEIHKGTFLNPFYSQSFFTNLKSKTMSKNKKSPKEAEESEHKSIISRMYSLN